MSKPKLIVVGAGGFGREVAWLASEADPAWEVAGFLDDDEALTGTDCGLWPVLGTVSQWPDWPDASFVVAVGSPRVRRVIVRTMEAVGAPSFATVIHRDARRSSTVEIGEGSMITAGFIATTDIRIGRHVIINLLTTIGHDVVMADYCTVAPQVAISGAVTFGEGVEVGTGASIRQGLHLGAGSMVGMGSVVTKDVPTDYVCFGAPARPVKALPAWGEG